MPDSPPTEAMSSPETDHDGLTVMGAWEPPPPTPPGIPGQPPAPDVTVPVARLLISNGDVVDVDRAVVIGRAPEGRRFNETEQPKLVTVPSPHLEISSTHIEVRPGSGADHGSAVVTDLGSTNGTVVVQPGLGPEDLSPGVTMQLIPGAIIDIGDGVTIQVTSP
jgi:FHA domain